MKGLHSIVAFKTTTKMEMVMVMAKEMEIGTDRFFFTGIVIVF